MMQSTNHFSLPDKNLPFLKRFGAFLLAHHLQEAAEVNLVLARQGELPILKSFSHLSEQESLTLVKESLETFFHQLEKQTVLEDARDALRKWRQDTLPILPRSGVAAADLVHDYHVRKQLLLSFLNRFTTDVNEAAAIAKELDLLFTQIEGFAFSLYVDLKEEEHGAVLVELQEKNRELATALEELQASEEQLVQSNNELEERVKERTGALAASELQLRTITDALPGMVSYVDRDERYRFLNQTYQEWFGIPRSQVLGKTLAEGLATQLGEIRGAQAYDHIREYVKRALEGEPLQYVNTFITKDGESKHVLVNYVPRLEQGQVVGYYGMFTDITARVEAEEALKQSEARFSNIFNQNSVGMAEVDLTGRFLLVNDRYCELVGRSREALYQIRMQDISHEEDVPQNMSLFQKAIEKGTPFAIEKRYTRADGSQVWVRNNVSVVKDPHNQPSSVVAICLDITKKKEAQEALQESKDLFQSFANHIQSLAWMADNTGKVMWYNQRWYEYTGIHPQERQPPDWEAVLHPEHVNRVVEHARKARQRGEDWELTMPLKRADGEWGWFLASARAIKDAEGKVIRWIGTCTDITEGVKFQQQLQKANEEIAVLLQREKLALAEVNAQRSTLYTTFMQAPSLLCITRERELVYELANPSYLEVFDLQEAIEGKRLDEVFPNPDPSIIAIHHQVMDTGIAYVGVELPVFSDWKKNGEPYTRYFNVRYAPLYEAGSVRGIITFGYEVTEHVRARHQLEQNALQLQALIGELHQKNLELSRINNDLDNFVYTASHDLKAPVSNIEGLLTMLKRLLPADLLGVERVERLFTLIEASIGRFRKTISDLASITQLQKESNQPATEVDLAELVEEVRLDLQEEIAQTDARLEVDTGLCPSVRFSRKNLRSIVYNLLSNAIKYRSPERLPRISLHCRPAGDWQVLTVSDNGLGMDLSKEEKVFAMFGRLHDHVEGSGVGLYMVKKMLENAGGRIELESQVGLGSTFRVYFPT
jgi:PAS domain S-box-containing protein